MTAPLLGMAMIVRDEAETIEACLDSFWDHVDRVGILDTGSKDDTMERVRTFADAKGERAKLSTGSFEWVDDFASARTAADALIPDCEVKSWVDADDILHGADQLRVLAAQMPPEVGAMIAHYDYAQDVHGNCVCHLKRERLVRQGAGQWQGWVHEAQVLQGAVMEVPPDMLEWRHRKPADRVATSARNMRILRKWLQAEPDNPRCLQYLGTEELGRGKPKRAIGYFKRYLKLKTGWDEERAQVHRKLAIALLALGRTEEAIATALEALRVLPSWPDSYLTLAEATYTLGEYAKSVEWAQRVVESGVPDTLLIVNPLDYLFQARLVLAASLGALGRLDEAITIGEQALSLIPDHGELLGHYRGWRTVQKREATADTVCRLAELLVGHDEQLAALDLMERSVPHFTRDHPRIVAMRSELRERVGPLLEPEGYRAHYTTGGSAPEDMIGDEQVDEIAGSLPRSHFLLEGLREQVAA